MIKRIESIKQLKASLENDFNKNHEAFIDTLCKCKDMFVFNDILK